MHAHVEYVLLGTFLRCNLPNMAGAGVAILLLLKLHLKLRAARESALLAADPTLGIAVVEARDDA